MSDMVLGLIMKESGHSTIGMLPTWILLIFKNKIIF